MQLNPFHKNFIVNRWFRLRRRNEIMARAKPIVINNKFLHKTRLDVCAKHAYARLIEQSPDLDWAMEVYTSHIMAMNGGYEEYPLKQGIDYFVSHFHAILQSIKHDGWIDNADGAIPISPKDNYLILNGAHRLAACILYGVTPKFYVDTIEDWCPWYTHSELLTKGMSAEILDYILLEYMRLVDSARVGIIWPAASAHVEKIKSVYKHGCEIIAEKIIPIASAELPFNIIRQVYAFEDWVCDRDDNSKDVNKKVQQCFPNEASLRVLVLRADHPETIELAKQEARKMIGISNDAMHTTDNYADTLQVAKLFFNQNSVDWAISAKPMETPKFKARLHAYRKAIGESDEFAIHGSSVMQAWGIREADDLDYISTDLRPLFSRRDISLDNEKVEYGDASLNKLLFDPRNYFYYNGVKVVSLNAVLEMKRARGEEKDMRDIEIANRYNKFCDAPLHRIPI